MITSNEELSSAIVKVLDEFTNIPVKVEIFFQGKLLNYSCISDQGFSIETILRTLQVLVVRGILNPDDLKIVETYINEDEMLEHEFSILPNGRLSETPESYLYSLNGELSLEISRYNRVLNSQEVKFNWDNYDD